MQNVHMLLGARCSRYSARVRSYLVKKDIQYVERTPTAWTFRVSIVRRFGDAAVPVLITPEGEWIADSTLILDHLERQYPDDPILPADPVHAVFATLADIWGSEFWQPVDLGTRWLRPENYPWWREELGEGFMAGFPKFLKNAAADRMAGVLHSHLPRVGATPEYAPLVLRWAGRQMDALEGHFAIHPYLLGERATRFDFGLICPFYGHIVQDGTSRRELLWPRPNLHAWVWRMNQPYLTGQRAADAGSREPRCPTRSSRSFAASSTSCCRTSNRLWRSCAARFPRRRPEPGSRDSSAWSTFHSATACCGARRCHSRSGSRSVPSTWSPRCRRRRPRVFAAGSATVEVCDCSTSTFPGSGFPA